MAWESVNEAVVHVYSSHEDEGKKIFLCAVHAHACIILYMHAYSTFFLHLHLSSLVETVAMTTVDMHNSFINTFHATDIF